MARWGLSVTLAALLLVSALRMLCGMRWMLAPIGICSDTLGCSLGLVVLTGCGFGSLPPSGLIGTFSGCAEVRLSPAMAWDFVRLRLCRED